MEETNLKKEKRKYLLMGIVLLLLVVVGAAVSYKKILQKKTLSENQNTSAKGEASLGLEYASQQRWFSGEVLNNMTALDVLQTASIAGKFDFKAGPDIISIDGFSNNASSSWVCYLNGDTIKTPLAKKNIYPKDKLLCQYKKNN